MNKKLQQSGLKLTGQTYLCIDDLKDFDDVLQTPGCLTVKVWDELDEVVANHSKKADGFKAAFKQALEKGHQDFAGQSLSRGVRESYRMYTRCLEEWVRELEHKTPEKVEAIAAAKAGIKEMTQAVGRRMGMPAVFYWDKSEQKRTGKTDSSELTTDKLIHTVAARKKIPLSIDLMEFACKNWKSLPSDVQQRFFSLLENPVPPLTSVQQKRIVELFKSHPEVLQQVTWEINFQELINDPYRILPPDPKCPVKEMVQGLALMAVDEQDVPKCSASYQDTPSERLNLIIWFRKHRFHIYREMGGSSGSPGVYQKTAPNEQLSELIQYRINNIKASDHKPELMTSLLCCVYSDADLLGLVDRERKLSDLPRKHKVILATRRGPEVARRVLDEKGYLTIGQLAEIIQAHPDILSEKDWRVMPTIGQLRMAEISPAVMKAMKQEVLSPPREAWLVTREHGDPEPLLERWGEVCKSSELDKASRSKWLHALEQLEVYPEVSRKVMSNEIPIPHGDEQFKAQLVLAAVCHNPELYLKQGIDALKLACKEQFPAVNNLNRVLAQKYVELKQGGVFGPEEFAELPEKIQNYLISHNEQAALDHWQTCKDKPALEYIAKRSLRVSLAMLEASRASGKDKSSLPREQLSTILAHIPHPEIKRRLALMELHTVNGATLEFQLRQKLEVAIRRQPEVAALRDDPALFQNLIRVVRGGQISLEGLSEQLESGNYKGLQELMGDSAMLAKMERSLGVRSLMLNVRDAGKSAYASHDQLVHGAMKYEAVAKELMLSQKPESVEFRRRLSKEEWVAVLGRHEALCKYATDRAKVLGINDDTLIDLGVRYPALGVRILENPASVLSDSQQLSGQQIVGMMARSGDLCRRVLIEPAYTWARKKLAPEDIMELAKKQTEVGRVIARYPDIALKLKLSPIDVFNMARSSSELTDHIMQMKDSRPFKNSDRPYLGYTMPVYIEGLAKARTAQAGKLMARALELKIVDVPRCVEIIKRNPEIPRWALYDIPEPEKGEIRKGLPEYEPSAYQRADHVPESEVARSYPGNCIPFNQVHDIGLSEIGKGCCAGFAIDFCLFCARADVRPEDYILKRDQWQANKETSDYMRKVRFYQQQQRRFADKQNLKTITVNGQAVSPSDPNASVIHRDGAFRLDVNALVADTRKHRGVYVQSTDHAIALTFRPGPDGKGDSLHLFDANHGLYRFDNFVGSKEQLEDLETLLGNWLLRTGKGSLKVSFAKLQEHTYKTPGISSP